MNDQDFRKIYEEALQAGLEAGRNFKPTPMIVEEHKNMLDDNSPVVKEYFIADGVCGFAWVRIKPATQPFARWLKKVGIVDSPDYYGGYSIWCHEFNQSMQRKEAWAGAVAEVLNRYGIRCHAQSRLD